MKNGRLDGWTNEQTDRQNKHPNISKMANTEYLRGEMIPPDQVFALLFLSYKHLRVNNPQWGHKVEKSKGGRGCNAGELNMTERKSETKESARQTCNA